MRSTDCSERRRPRLNRDGSVVQTFKSIFLKCHVTYVIKHDLYYISVTEIITVLKNRLIAIVAPSKAWVCCSLLAGIAGSNPAEAWIFVSCEYCVFSGRDFCVRADLSSRGVLPRVIYSTNVTAKVHKGRQWP